MNAETRLLCSKNLPRCEKVYNTVEEYLMGGTRK